MAVSVEPLNILWNGTGIIRICDTLSSDTYVAAEDSKICTLNLGLP